MICGSVSKPDLPAATARATEFLVMRSLSAALSRKAGRIARDEARGVRHFHRMRARLCSRVGLRLPGRDRWQLAVFLHRDSFTLSSKPSGGEPLACPDTS